MLKAYRYKLKPNQSRRYALARTLDVCRALYNDCLYQRKLQPSARERPLCGGAKCSECCSRERD